MITSDEIEANFPVDTYLVHRHRLDIIDCVWKDDSADDSFFLKHPDDKGNHILVNDLFDIVEVIDWEWTSMVSKAEAFAPPCMVWPVAEFYEVSNELAAEQLRLASIFRERGSGGTCQMCP
jgi:hypothetical protein